MIYLVVNYDSSLAFLKAAFEMLRNDFGTISCFTIVNVMLDH